MAGAKDEAQANWELMTGPALEGFEERFKRHTEQLRERHPSLRGSPGEWAVVLLSVENEVLRAIMKTMSARVTALEAAATNPEERHDAG
jgi:hypothetical protein